MIISLYCKKVATVEQDHDFPLRKMNIRRLVEEYQMLTRKLELCEECGPVFPDSAEQSRFDNKKGEITLSIIRWGKRLGFSLNEIYSLILSNSRKEKSEEHRSGLLALSLLKKKLVEQIDVLTERRDDIEAVLSELTAASDAKTVSRAAGVAATTEH